MLGPGELHLTTEADRAEPSVAMPRGGHERLEAHVGELADGPRRQAVAAGLLPRQRLLLDDDDVPARVGEPVRATRAARTGADDDDVVDRRRDVVERVVRHARILMTLIGADLTPEGVW